jgi:ERCC4-related helicase
MLDSRPPEQGSLVQVRQRPFVVLEVQRSAPLTSPLRGQLGAPQHLVTLSSVEDDALGEELQVIWEIEPGAQLAERVVVPTPSGFDDPARLDAFLDAVRWGAASSADVHALQAPFRSGIEIEDYQLDPVVRAIQMPRANLLIADDVGLGKTIEAGLVCQELLLRHRVRKVLVVCPASLQIQWRDQMRDKFGLEFRIVDAELMRRLRRERGLHVNPWTHFPRLITSIDFLKRERPMRLMSEALPAEGEPVYPRRFDLLIVDEAHNVAPSGRGKYPLDSLRTQAIRRLAPHFEHKLFLSATPHNGYPESFTALLELLDSQRFARSVAPDRGQLAAVMVRRLKSEFTDWAGDLRFPRRELAALEVDYTEEERRIHALLREYSASRLRNATQRATPGAERYATEFVVKLLKKRLFSSPEAFATTLERHITSLETARIRSAPRPLSEGLLQRQIERVEEEFGDEEAFEEATSDALDGATRLFREPNTEERALLEQMRAWASKARYAKDSKTMELITWLRRELRPGGEWSDQRVIIFTEYRDTQRWLQTILASEGLTQGDRLMTLHGGMDTVDRERVKAAFQAHPTLSPVRILLATDAASEGIDLQNHCSRLIHFEIPWNPNRMEQRNGRIDRHGQRAPAVAIYHFVAAGYARAQAASTSGQMFAARPGDLEADLEFLMRAALKVNQIREDLGSVGPVIAEQVEEAMLGRRVRLETEVAERGAAPSRSLLKFERKLREQVQALHMQLQESRRELHLSPENVHAVVTIALELAGQPKLREATVSGIWPDPTGRRTTCPVFYLPALSGSWAGCTDGLSHPHTGKIRPIVFDDTLAAGRDDVVLAHLNHRLVQMSLRLLRAEVWSATESRKLHRVTARLIPTNMLDTPAVVIHARLMLLGGDSQRLHEELIVAGGELREGRFVEIDEERLSEALESALPVAASSEMRQRLAASWPSHEAALLAALEKRKQALTRTLQRTLAERERKETRDVALILEELRKSILEELNQPEVVQLELFSPPEKEQLERNRRFLEQRVAQIPDEIVREQETIRKRFADPQARLFPVAVTYLVPEKYATAHQGGYR